MILLGDCLVRLKELEENSVDSVVTDPPYGLSFMGKKWDYDVPSVAVFSECLRVLKPGGHLLSFGGTRTYHRLACNVEDSGFEIRDQIQWLYGSGFPKSHNLKDKWQGWGTALKPANEPIVLARKPLSESTVAKNVLRWDVGGLNIDASRIVGRAEQPGSTPDTREGKSNAMNEFGRVAYMPHTQGRWPANLLLDEEAAAMLDQQSGIEASRFFYVAKASKAERNAGLDSYERIAIDNECKEENTAAVQLLQRVISESTVKWSTGESGHHITALFPKECKSTIRTEINKIIESKILSYLMLSLTSGSTPAAFFSRENGGNLVESVTTLDQWIRDITNGKTELARGANAAALRMLQKINESENAPLNNFHSTVKPIKLMEYLIRLITPPGGTVLDPFMGSGSTGVAAHRLGYNFIGIEMSEEYVAIAEKRISHAGGAIG